MKKNVVMLIGNLGADVETRNLESGNQVSNFTVATSEKYKDKKGELVENTEWHRIVAWGRQSELAEKYLKKGSKVGIEGKLTTRKWEDKEGNTQYTTEVVAYSILMLDSKSDSQSASKPSSQPKTATSSEEDDDLPF